MDKEIIIYDDIFTYFTYSWYFLFFLTKLNLWDKSKKYLNEITFLQIIY